MKKEETLQAIENAIEPVVEAEGYELIKIELNKEPVGLVLRFYLDKSDGISIDDCAYLSEKIAPLLDQGDFIKKTYHLEVSSPGLNRPLVKPKHFRRFLGKQVKVETKGKVEGRHRFRGFLIDVNDEGVEIKVGGQAYFLNYLNIKKANLEHQFD
jgi:ribosome maturation factor RimP